MIGTKFNPHIYTVPQYNHLTAQLGGIQSMGWQITENIP